MKLKLITIILATLISSTYCASSCCAINEANDVSFNETFLIEGDSGQISNLTTFDLVPLLNKFIMVPAGKNVSAFEKTFCKVNSNGYDFTGTLLETYCEANGNYSLTLTSGDRSLTLDSVDGSLLVSDFPNGEFSAHISNKDDVELSCETYLMGIGSDTTPEEGFNINLSCYDKLPNGGSRLRGLGLLLLSILFAL